MSSVLMFLYCKGIFSLGSIGEIAQQLVMRDPTSSVTIPRELKRSHSPRMILGFFAVARVEIPCLNV